MMNGGVPSWFTSLRALLAATPLAGVPPESAVGFRVDGAEFCCNAAGREIGGHGINGWFAASREVFVELSQGVKTPQQAFVEGRLRVEGDPEVVCAVSLLFERLARL